LTGFPRLALPQERFLAIMVLRVFRCWIISMHFIRYKEAFSYNIVYIVYVPFIHLEQ
jgi:hypothetical protein